MSRDIISKATRNEFREILTDFVLREIDMIFESANLTPDDATVPNVSGQRRGRVEKYYANIDFSSLADIKKLAAAYDEVIVQLEKGKSAAYPDVAENIDATVRTLVRRMERDGFKFENGCFRLERQNISVVSATSLVDLSEDSINEHLEKARHKIHSGDNAGAIATAYTLIEQFLKELLRKTETEFKEDEGDIRALYKLVATPLNLNPAGENLESYLKSILEGLKQQICGLYALANKASDRHARRYDPSKHHAKLAVNVAFSLCEFILDSYHYQRERTERRRVQDGCPR